MLAALLVLASQDLSSRMPPVLSDYYAFVRGTPAVMVRWRTVSTTSSGKRTALAGSQRVWLARGGAIKHDVGTGSFRVWAAGKGIQVYREAKVWRSLGSWEEVAAEPVVSYGLSAPKRDENAREWGYFHRKDRHAGLDLVTLRAVLGVDAQRDVTWVLGSSGKRLVRLIVEDVTIAGPSTREFQVLGFRRLASASSRVFSVEPPKDYKKVLKPPQAETKRRR